MRRQNTSAISADEKLGGFMRDRFIRNHLECAISNTQDLLKHTRAKNMLPREQTPYTVMAEVQLKEILEDLIALRKDEYFRKRTLVREEFDR